MLKRDSILFCQTASASPCFEERCRTSQHGVVFLSVSVHSAPDKKWSQSSFGTICILP